MQQLSKRLQRNDEECFSDTTLAGVMALTLYELQAGTSTQASGWLSHVRGATSLVKLRGERNFANTFGFHLYFASQLNDLIHAVGRRKRMLASADWSELQYGKEPPSAIQLFDILQELPSIIEYADAIKAAQTGTEDHTIVNHLLALTGRAQSFELRLTEWFSKLEKDQSQQSNPLLFWPEPSTLYTRVPPSHPSRVFPTFLCFPDMAIAEQVVLCWTALLFIPRLLHYTEQRLKQDGELPSSYRVGSSLSALATDSTDLAKKVAQSLEYFLHPDVGLMELQFIGFPMNLAMATCNSLGLKEAAFFGLVRARLKETNTGMGDFLDTMLAKGGGLAAVRLLVS
ncbi:hypothetical protein H2200_002086 [Cladophialophora chaetospira]|uniref:Uncharacterized protein n=1 Tax=Cladophialophora chaetospira TaxID=386627 RepID=A0AA38XI83_9EURO|nr:hypothetical protein H2200_002086 [Cladophialophora chaetospira]